MRKLAVERRQYRTYASLNSFDPTAAFEKDFLLVLLFDNIGFRKSGFKVGYDQWVLLAWQYLMPAEQRELGLLGLSKEAIPFATAFPSEQDEYVRAVLPAAVDYENVSRHLSTLLDGVLVNYVSRSPSPRRTTASACPSSTSSRPPSSACACRTPAQALSSGRAAADEHAADEVEADEEDEADEADEKAE